MKDGLKVRVTLSIIRLCKYFKVDSLGILSKISWKPLAEVPSIFFKEN